MKKLTIGLLCIVLVTGHSLGAAVANLLAVGLNDDPGDLNIGSGDIYAYTFGTPNVEKDIPTPVVHDNIFNMLNERDFVTWIPVFYGCR